MAKLVSVVIPMRNEEAYIGACLASLAAQDLPPGQYEVLVVDGLSTDRSRAIVEDWSAQRPSFRLLDNPRRITSAALNVGAMASRGDVILLLGAHATVAPDFLRENLLCLEETGADAVGGPLQHVAHNHVGRAISAAMSCPFGVGNAVFRYAERGQYTDTVAFAAYRRSVFERVGYFDDSLVMNEDDEFNYRLGEAGGKLYLSPRIRSTYYVRPSLLRLFRQYLRYGFWKVEIMKRHPRSARARQLVPAAFVAGLVASGAVSFVYWPAGLAFGVILGAYLAASLAVSVWVAARHGWSYLPVLPLAFACLHFGYGLGFLAGLARRLWPFRKKAADARA